MKNTKRLQTEVDNLKRDATSSLQKFDSIKAELERLQSSLDDQYIDLIRLRGQGKKLQGDFDLADDTEVSKVVTDIDKRMRYYLRSDTGNNNNPDHKKSSTESSADDQTTSAPVPLPPPSPPICGAAIIEQLWNCAKNPNRNPQDARTAVANGASVDARSEKWASDINVYPTPFCEACKNRHYDLIRVLATSVENGGLGCDRNVLNRNRETQLVRACMDGTAHELVKLLIELDCNTELCDERGRSPLLIATEHDDVELVKIICNSNKINVNCGDQYGITPLMMAAQNGNEEIVKTLLEKDPSAASAISTDGSTALHFACQEIGEGQLACAELLLECEYVNPNAQDSEDRTPLMVAIESNNVKVLVQLLLFEWKIHTEVRCQSQNGKTALFLACDVTARTGGDALILYLLRSGRAKMDATLDNGMNVLMYCAAEGNDVALRCIYNTSYEKFLQLLNSVDDENKTALNHACRRRQFSTAERLVKTGKCDLNIQDNTNSSPLSICCEIGASDIAKLLLDAGADAKWNNSQYSSLTALATDRGQTQIVKLLKEHAATEKKKKEEGERRLEEFHQAVEALKQSESQGRNSISIEIDSVHKKFKDNEMQLRLRLKLQKFKEHEQQARHLSLKHEQEDSNSRLKLSVETTFRKTKIPGFLTFDNRLPVFDNILARKVRRFYPLCSFTLGEFIPESSMSQEVSGVMPHGMQVMPCFVVGPKLEVRRAHASIQQALESSSYKSTRDQTEFVISADRIPESRQGVARSRTKDAAAVIDIHVDFVSKKSSFFCSTIFLRDEDQSNILSVSDMKTKVLSFLMDSENDDDDEETVEDDDEEEEEDDEEDDNDPTKKLLRWSRLCMECVSPFQFIHIAGTEKFHLSTYSNDNEAKCIVSLINSMLRFGVNPSSITVLTNFVGQRQCIRERLSIVFGLKCDINVTCIEDFVGKESDIIIMSMVRNQKDDNFLNKTDLNTSVSRARALAIIVGDGEMVQNANSKAWNNFMSMLKNPETHGMFNYDYRNERLIHSTEFKPKMPK